MKKAVLVSARIVFSPHRIGAWHPHRDVCRHHLLQYSRAFNTQLGLLGLSDLSVDFIPGSPGNPLQGQTSDGLFTTSALQTPTT
jgi:hypothetical protein